MHSRDNVIHIYMMSLRSSLSLSLHLKPTLNLTAQLVIRSYQLVLQRQFGQRTLIVAFEVFFYFFSFV
jgi:hypothetical protein